MIIQHEKDIPYWDKKLGYCYFERLIFTQYAERNKQYMEWVKKGFNPRSEDLHGNHVNTGLYSVYRVYLVKED